MTDRIRIGAVSYLNARPLVFGLERGGGGARVELSYGVPSEVADRMARGELDVALLPSIELARIPDLEIVPGLGIVTRGPARSVLLAARVPLDQVRRVSLDPESRTSNALARVLFAEAWGVTPEFRPGPASLGLALKDCDAALRIGDKALFEPLPEGVSAYDLGRAWTDLTGLPFVFAVWAAREGVLDRELYRAMHDSRREGVRHLDEITGAYTWNGSAYPDVARAYLRDHILYRFGSSELRSLETFFGACARAGLIPRVPEIRMGLRRRTTCDETAELIRGRTP